MRNLAADGMAWGEGGMGPLLGRILVRSKEIVFCRFVCERSARTAACVEPQTTRLRLRAFIKIYGLGG